ncbi:MAG: hypothetical protein LBH46_04370 [Rickettsiales bacterium]|jgi:hypothetical protein|nr:hypothetical protein [Rickettsiales bacterium]
MKNLFNILEKTKQSVELLTTPVIGLVAIWKGFDATLYIGATASLLISIISYIELFISPKKRSS